ncbi:PKD domain-containing protein [Lutibacter sp. HS1-25]|uniref:PKD domain-containing protein n=1 Tax=Lutibacter sp. HS1-25 TaxID=2485000 RepID=UPI001013936E|nr:PKD domain-containing protein [Lutibacter sp. HS1-25]RXP45224.1 PKD domain-containing protein [Lutibacter sp. HS1-25]
MNNNFKYKKHISTSVLMVSIFMLSIFATSCEFDLPEANSIPDATPPSAAFSETIGADYLTYTFGNFSASATDYLWDFGDGSTSTEFEPEHAYTAQASDETEAGTTYTITLTVKDKLNVESSLSKDLVIKKPAKPIVPVPVIGEPGFEDLTLPDGTGDGRDSWRCSFGEIMQITSSPVTFGKQAAKFPSDGSRVAYQEVAVTKNADYVLTYWYTIKTTPVGSVTVSVLAGSIGSLAEAADATIISSTGNDQSDDSVYVQVDVPFNSGDNSIISLLITNEGAECRVDEFSIAVAE